MPYNNPSPSQSTTLSPAERSAEARRLLRLLRDEGDDQLCARLTNSAYSFVQQQLDQLELLEEMGSKADLVISPNQLLYLRDLWARFA